jgi:tetratricopeptide (TPR) repeat protein
MKRRRRRLLLALALVGGAGGAAAWTAVPTPVVAPPDAVLAGERGVRDTQLVVWRRALAADPASALVLAQLAGLHLQRAREGGGWEDHLEAERLARASLAVRWDHNGAAAVTLAGALMAQHRFHEAEAVARALGAREPEVPAYHAQLGEIALELGHDALADSAFGGAWGGRDHLSVAPRLARWYERRGAVPLARRLLESGRRQALARRDLPREVSAWYALRLADLERRAGRPRHAARRLREGLALVPDDPRLLAAMARLSFERGRARDAIAWGERALAIAPEPDLLHVLAEAHAARGDDVEAARLRRAFDRLVRAPAGPFHRSWALALLDRGERVEEMLAFARHEAATRGDPYALDLLAWALHRSGRSGEARAPMAEALRRAGHDPLLVGHARAIGVAVPGAGAGPTTRLDGR